MFRDAAATQDGDPATGQHPPDGAGPRGGPGVPVEVLLAGQDHPQCRFGHCRGIDPLPAGPRPTVIQVVGEGLDARVGQLDPFQVSGVSHHLREAVHACRVGPDKSLGVGRFHEPTAAGRHGPTHHLVHGRTGVRGDGDRTGSHRLDSLPAGGIASGRGVGGVGRRTTTAGISPAPPSRRREPGRRRPGFPDATIGLYQPGWLPPHARRADPNLRRNR